MVASVCGAFECESCKHFLKQICPGCRAGNELLEADGKPVCTIFDCARSQGIEGCVECPKPVCESYERPEFVCPLRSHLENQRWWLGKLIIYFDTRWGRAAGLPRPTSERTITRLRWYVDALDEFAAAGQSTISSSRIAHKVSVTPTLVRKDLSYFGGFGRRGVGYNIAFLREKIAEILGLGREKNIAWFGAQWLHLRPDEIEKLAKSNCRVVAVFDRDQERLGTRIGELQVMDVSMARQVVKNLDVEVAVIACAEADAQWAADQLVMAGVTALLNLTPAILVVPGNIMVRNLDLVSEMLALSSYCGLREGRDVTNA
jgi:redox-sensing transcriptional repressor